MAKPGASGLPNDTAHAISNKPATETFMFDFILKNPKTTFNCYRQREKCQFTRTLYNLYEIWE